MSGTSRRGAVRASRPARAAALSGTSGKVCPADRATLLLEAIIEPGDRVTIEGDNQKQAEFPQLKQFSTLSPVPGFRRWHTQQYT
jgi:malonate decarboxylase alpha subunit